MSRVYFWYNIRNPVESLTDQANFRTVIVSADANKESADEYGEQRIRQLFSRWFDGQNDAQALNSASRILATYKNNPEYYQFDLDAKDRSLDVGDVVQVTHRALVDSQGALTATNMQIISREEVESGHKVRYRAQKFGYIGRFAFVMADSANDYDSATDEEIATGGYISDANGLMSDGSDGYKII